MRDPAGKSNFKKKSECAKSLETTLRSNGGDREFASQNSKKSRVCRGES